ncbi:MAG: polyprenyl synthetase family protein [Phycisphaerales bacterium]|nr:MAG: polyprenyl synthetase family protein [Phycisphaerales bacterium]
MSCKKLAFNNKMNMKLDEIYEPIASDLETVENRIASCVEDSKSACVRALCRQMLGQPAKRIRPALAILSEKGVSVGRGGRHSCESEATIDLAVAVELIHMASLIHDDLIDKATMRRGSRSANARWGANVAVMLGAYIFSKAFELVVRFKIPGVFECLSEAACRMCEGEASQVRQRHNWELSEDSYIDIAANKTAALFAGCCHAATIVGGRGRLVQAAMKQYGLNLGVAFQIMDDCMDFTAEEAELGKCPGQDMLAGDITLPLLSLSQWYVTEKGDRKELTSVGGNSIDRNKLESVREVLVDSGALCRTQERIVSHATTAKEYLDVLPGSDYKNSLANLADYVMQRIPTQARR